MQNNTDALSRKAANLRAGTILVAAVAAFLAQSSLFRALAPDWLVLVVGAVSVLATTYRAWLDQSSSRVVRDTDTAPSDTAGRQP